MCPRKKKKVVGFIFKRQSYPISPVYPLINLKLGALQKLESSFKIKLKSDKAYVCQGKTIHWNRAMKRI